MNAKERLYELIEANQPLNTERLYKYALLEGIATRRTVIKSMLKDLQTEGTVLVYNNTIEVKSCVSPQPSPTTKG